MGIHIIFVTLLFFIYYITGGGNSEYNDRIRQRQVTFMGILMFVFAALRSPTVGIDILGFENGETGYYKEYLVDAYMSFKELLVFRTGRDPVFHCFLKMLSYISPSPQIMLVVVGGVFAFGFSYFVYHSKGNVLLSFMMLIGFRIFSFSLSGLRQALALGFVYIAFICLRDRRIFAYFLLTILAALFHKSALVFFISFPLIYIRSFYVIIALSILLLLNLFTNGFILNQIASLFYEGRFDNYIERSSSMGFEGGATFFIFLLFYLFILIFYRAIKRHNASFGTEFNLLSLGIAFSILGQSMDNVFRIAYYFIFLLFPASSQLIKCVSGDRKTYSFICFLISFFLAVQYIILGPGAGTDQYQFFWQYASC